MATFTTFEEKREKLKAELIELLGFLNQEHYNARLEAEQAYLAELYDGETPIATRGITNSIGIAIFDINYDDYTVISAFHNGEKYSDFAETHLNYDDDDETGLTYGEFVDDERPFFSRQGERYYIDDFVLVNAKE